MTIKDAISPRKLKLPKNINGLGNFFNHHLDRWYCAKAHLAERLGEIEGFGDEPLLSEAITETIRSTESQLFLVEHLYELIGRTYSFERCERMISFLNEYFNAVQVETENDTLYTLFFAAYLSYVRSVEQSSLTLLQMCAEKVGDGKVTKLLKMCAKDQANDNALLTVIKSKINAV